DEEVVPEDEIISDALLVDPCPMDRGGGTRAKVGSRAYDGDVRKSGRARGQAEVTVEPIPGLELPLRRVFGGRHRLPLDAAHPPSLEATRAPSPNRPPEGRTL